MDISIRLWRTRKIVRKRKGISNQRSNFKRSKDGVIGCCLIPLIHPHVLELLLSPLCSICNTFLSFFSDSARFDGSLRCSLIIYCRDSSTSLVGIQNKQKKNHSSRRKYWAFWNESLPRKRSTLVHLFVCGALHPCIRKKKEWATHAVYSQDMLAERKRRILCIQSDI